jgi:hypothetical protein
MLSSVVFRCVVRHHKDPGGHVLVGMRTKEPAKRRFLFQAVRKNETLRTRLRISLNQKPVLRLRSDAKLMGVYEHVCDSNTRGEDGYGDPLYCVSS